MGGEAQMVEQLWDCGRRAPGLAAAARPQGRLRSGRFLQPRQPLATGVGA